MLFEPFPKIGRLSKNATIMEKIDGTNAQIALEPASNNELAGHRAEHVLAVVGGLAIYAGSRNRWLKLGDDNFGFAKWVYDHAEQLVSLGEGRHFGEWWGQGIQRGYGLTEKRFSLFNPKRWNDQNPNRPACCHVVPVLSVCPLWGVDAWMDTLRENGSYAAPGFMNPEGVVIFHEGNQYKRTFEYDTGKWTTAA